ncbi:MAG: tRNA (N(6)-L-threonylcarbamoyladenosine(37)-C(2))-methylthiotransferase MtaB [Lachnospiraceae bacterium]|nr:tRNA (N(6)-L-threonylcarbamoyladenosine(37)-C(2))-methylthiotransferase MtaB [Lachnospiraceae bacterium]
MDRKKTRVCLYSLGCKVNGYETDRMAEKFREAGYRVVPPFDAADVYIINTCTVTNIADRKSRKMLRHAAKANPDAVVVAAGCYVDAEKQFGAREADEKIADLWVANKEKEKIVAIVEEYLESRCDAAQVGVGEEKTKRTCEEDGNQSGEKEDVQINGHTRAYLKIQDGCNQFCSYCIIPFARGRVVSRRPEEVLAETERLAAAGYREIVLTGIHISSYGLDFSKFDLIDLVREICSVNGIDRIRLGSMEPRIITEENIRALAGLKKVCPHFHLSLQSGCDATLRRMNRHYTAAEYLEKCEIIRRYFPDAAITTDVIVGFPGETEEEFETTKEFLARVRFARMHIFKYSARRGTRAAVMDHQIPEPVKDARSAILRKLNLEMEEAFARSFLEKTVDVLFEETVESSEGERVAVGHTPQYLKVEVVTDRDLRNQILKVLLTREMTERGEVRLQGDIISV